jgi:glutamate dehydrogenase (NAD(P)+)
MRDNEPYILVEWHDTESEAKGWLCAYNFVNNYCGGGTRMHPTVTADEVVRLANAMGYKYKACESITTGGCKGGIAYDYKAADAKDVLRRYLMAMSPYINAGVSIGGDLGVDYADVLDILDEIGIGLPQTQAMRADSEQQKRIRDHDNVCKLTYDGFLMYDMITGYGCAAALDEAWTLKGNLPKDARVLIQGFGCAGASMANCLDNWGYKIVAIADANCLVTCESGLNVKKLVETRLPKGEMNPAAFESSYLVHDNSKWLDVDCDILVPAALEDVINKDNADKVKASLIVEAANIPITHEADKILAQKGIDVCVDFITNMGGIRIYEVVVFGLVKPEPNLIAEDTMSIIRRQTRRVFEEAIRGGKTTRQVARALFAPQKSTYPDVPKVRSIN